MKPTLVKAFAVFGVVSLVAWLALGVGVWRLTRDDGRGAAMTAAPIQVSPVAAKIAAKFAPALQSLAEEHKDEVVASAGNAIYRYAARQVFPTAVKAIPRATEIGCDKALSYLDSMPMSEVAGLMIEHAKARGCRVDYTVWQMARSNQQEPQ